MGRTDCSFPLQHGTFTGTVFFYFVSSLILLSCSGTAWADINSRQADLVLGQGDFAHASVNCVDGVGFNFSAGVAFDTTTGRVYMVDNSNNRVLWWNDKDSLADGAPADGVVGQPDLDSVLTNVTGASTARADGLWGPHGLAVDGAGNLWVADYGNNRVLEFTAPVSTGSMAAALVLGQPNMTTRTGGTSINVLRGPRAVTVDASGNVWVADTGNNRVIEFAAPFHDGKDAALVLGQQDFNSMGVGTSSATLNSPRGIALDAAGNVWVSDYTNNRVLRYSAPAYIGQGADLALGQADLSSVQANRGLGSPGVNTINQPWGVGLDASGAVFVSDYGNNRIVKYSGPFATGMDACLVLGQPGFWTGSANRGGPAGPDTLYQPAGLNIDERGSLWVADMYNHRVLRYADPAESDVPADLVLGQTDFYTGVAQSIDGRGFGSYGSVYNDIAIDKVSGRVYATDYTNNRVLWWNSVNSLSSHAPADGVLGQGDVHGTTANRGLSAPRSDTLSGPSAVAVDGSGNVWVSDYNNHRVLCYGFPAGNGAAASFVIGQNDMSSNASATSINGLKNPAGLAVDASGQVWVADRGNNRVLCFQPPFHYYGMNAALVLGQSGFGSGGSGTSDTALYTPTRVAADPNGSLWVADASNNRVLRFSAPFSTNMKADLVLGQANFTSGIYNRTGATKPGPDTLRNPYGVAPDPSVGSVWIADVGNNRAVQYTLSFSTAAARLAVGQVSLTTGTANAGTSTTKPPNINGLYYPSGIAFDAKGNVWITDNHNIRVVKWNGMTITSVTPAQGGNLGTVNIPNLAGSGFSASSEVRLTKAGESDIVATGVSAGPTAISCTVDLAGKATGVWNIAVSSGGPGAYTVVLPGGFLVTSLSVSGANPNIGVNSGSLGVEIAGQGFVNGCDVTLKRSGQPDIAGAGVSFVDSTKLTCTFDLAGRATGFWDVVVTTGGPGAVSATQSNGFAITLLMVSSMTPCSGRNTGFVSIASIWGLGFAAGTDVRLSKTGQANNWAYGISVLSSTAIACSFDLTGQATGFWDVIVSTGGLSTFSAKLTGGFEVYATAPFVPLPAPVTDLTAYQAGDNAIKLTWTYPGPGTLAPGEKYAVWYASYTAAPSTASAQIVITTGPVPSGAWQTVTVNGLEGGTTYYFNVWASSGGVTNWSGLSNGATNWAYVTPPDPNNATNVFRMYDDAGLGPGIATSLPIWSPGGLPSTIFLTVNERTDSNGITFDPDKYYRLSWTAGAAWNAFAFPAVDTTTMPVDLTHYKSLVVYWKTISDGTAASSKRITLKVQDTTGAAYSSVQYMNPALTWQKIEIPTSSITGINMRSVAYPLIVLFQTAAVYTIDMDCMYYSIVDTAPPPVPSLLTPAAAGVVAQARPSFDWSDVGDPSFVYYGVQVATAATFWSPAQVANAANISVSTYTAPADLALGATYYWRVSVTDANDNSQWSAPSSFYLLGPPGKVTGITGAGAAGGILFSWTAPGDEGYSGNVSGGAWEIHYSSKTRATAYTAEYSVLESSSWTQGLSYSETIGGLQPGTTYYFWIRARNSGGSWSVWSDTAAFKTLASDVLVLSSLSPGTGYNSGPLAPVEVDGQGFAAGCEVQLVRSGQSDIPAAGIQVLSSTAIVCGFDLTGAATGYWDVRVSTGGPGSGSFTLSGGFRVLPLSVTSITPASGVNTGVVNITNLSGAGFVSGCQVRLTRSGDTDITGTVVSVVSPSRITCSFDLAGRSTGYWNVAVSTGQVSGLLDSGFRIFASTAADATAVDPARDATIVFPVTSGNVKAEIPAGTFSEPVHMTVTELVPPASDQGTLKLCSLCYEIANDKGLQPQKEFVLKIPYTLADITTGGLEERKLTVFRRDETSRRWIALPSQAFPDEMYVRATVNHLSKFAVAQFAPATDLSNVKVFPNPYSPIRNPLGLVIDNLPAAAEIRLYSVAGEFIGQVAYTDGSGRAVWSGRNDSGSMVANDVYIAVIKGAGEMKKIKIGVER